jgi:Arf-GAP/coiled-coil/ANK repeat/PH domain-containing protein
MPVGFSHDFPAFRKEADALYESVKAMQATADRLARASCRDCQASIKRAEAGISLANEVQAASAQQHFGGVDGDGAPAEGNLAVMLAEVAASMRTLHTWQRDAAAATEARVAHAVQTRAEEDARRCKEARARFVGCDETWASALARSHAVRLENNGGVRRADKDFVSTKLAFEASRFELCAALNESEASKALALMELVSANVAEQLSYFEEGAARLRELKRLADGWAPAVESQREIVTAERERNEATRSHLAQLAETSSALPLALTESVGREANDGAPAHLSEAPHREGYLFKKSSRLGGQVSSRLGGQVSKQLPATGWKRLWFKLENGQLAYYRQAKGNSKTAHGAAPGTPGGMAERVINLLICTVQPRERETGKRFCFDVVSPYRTYTLQAESESQRTAWVDDIRAAVEHSIYCLDAPPHRAVVRHSGAETAGSGDGPRRQILGHSSLSQTLWAARADTSACADCGDASSRPTWAVLPYGVLCCIACSGIHRSLGTHVSKVRSIVLDSWTPEMASLLLALGGSNQLLLATAPAGAATGPDQAERERWIRSKYEARAHVAPRPPVGRAELCEAAAADEPLRLLELLLASGAGVMASGGAGGRGSMGDGTVAPIHAAAAADAPLCCELLLLHSASLELRSMAGRTPLHVAAASGAVRCVALLLRRGADADAADADGCTPLELARRHGHDGCVAALEEQMRPTPVPPELQSDMDDPLTPVAAAPKHLTPGRKVRGFIGSKLNLNVRRGSTTTSTSTPSSPVGTNTIFAQTSSPSGVHRRASSDGQAPPRARPVSVEGRALPVV